MFKLILLRLTILFTVIIIFCNKSVGQNNVSAIASATIMAPENSTKLQSVYYARFSDNIDSDKIQINNKELGSLINNIEFKTQNQSIASFYIPGDYLYYITLPQEDIILKRNDGEETIFLTGFNIIPQKSNELNTTLLAIVACLTLKLPHIFGNYSAHSPSPITVHYN